MKKILLALIIGLILTCGNNFSNAQVLKKGDVMIIGFTSYPNWGKFLLETALSSSNVNSYSVTGVPPSGAKVEFMLSNEIGFTLDGIFNGWNAKWDQNGYNYEAGIFRTRIQIGLNYHIPDLDSDNLDLYGGFGIGSNTNSRKFNTDDPYAAEEEFIENSFLTFPMSARVRVGGTYYVSHMVGINAELALGGPVIGVGVIFKL